MSSKVSSSAGVAGSAGKKKRKKNKSVIDSETKLQVIKESKSSLPAKASSATEDMSGGVGSPSNPAARTKQGNVDDHDFDTEEDEPLVAIASKPSTKVLHNPVSESQNAKIPISTSVASVASSEQMAASNAASPESRVDKTVDSGTTTSTSWVTGSAIDTMTVRVVDFRRPVDWVSELLKPDPDQTDNMIEIYEAGFSMYLSEKGIVL
jgi:ribosomal protein S8E